jgi:hypothetical protein
MNSLEERILIRTLHLVLSIPIIGFIYGPVAHIPPASRLHSFCGRATSHPERTLDVAKATSRALGAPAQGKLSQRSVIANRSQGKSLPVFVLFNRCGLARAK